MWRARKYTIEIGKGKRTCQLDTALIQTVELRKGMHISAVEGEK
jgi:hypothetical protein